MHTSVSGRSWYDGERDLSAGNLAMLLHGCGGRWLVRHGRHLRCHQQTCDGARPRCARPRDWPPPHRPRSAASPGSEASYQTPSPAGSLGTEERQGAVPGARGAGGALGASRRWRGAGGAAVRLGLARLAHYDAEWLWVGGSVAPSDKNKSTQASPPASPPFASQHKHFEHSPALVGRPHSRLRVAPTLGARSGYLLGCLGGEFSRETSENVVRQTSAQRVRCHGYGQERALERPL